MSRDNQYSKSYTYREISDRDLFYDLEYNLIERENTTFEINSVMVYLLFVSGILNFFFNINQTYTFGAIIIYLILSQFANTHFRIRERVIGLVIIIFGNVVDHIQAELLILPGVITNDTFTTMTWVFEILWVLIYGVEFLSIFAPVQQPSTPGRTITPASERSKKNYEGMARRVAGSSYAITDFDEDVDTELLQETFRNLVQYIASAFLLIVFLDLIIWRIVSVFAGGENTDEAYFVSGMSFIIFVLLLFFVGLLFSNGNSDEKTY